MGKLKGFVEYDRTDEKYLSTKAHGPQDCFENNKNLFCMMCF